MQCHRLEPAFQAVVDAILREQDRIAGRRHDLAGKPVDQLPIGGAPEEPEYHVPRPEGGHGAPWPVIRGPCISLGRKVGIARRNARIIRHR